VSRDAPHTDAQRQARTGPDWAPSGAGSAGHAHSAESGRIGQVQEALRAGPLLTLRELAYRAIGQRVPVPAGRGEEAAPMTVREERLARCRAILYGSAFGQPLAGADHDFLAALLALHPDAPRKCGAGVEHFEVRANPRFPGQRTFWLVRRDGSETDWSFMRCLDGTAPVRGLVQQALRAEVVDQVVEFKQRGLAAGERCALTGVPLDDSCHVDHDAPRFEELADAFVARHGGYERMAITASEDGLIGRRLTDAVLTSEWRVFHAARARLRLVTAHANLTRPRRTEGQAAAVPQQKEEHHAP